MYRRYVYTNLFIYYPQYPSGVQLSFYVPLSISLYGRVRLFLVIIVLARNCAQRMRPQATGSNTLSGSIIHPSVCPVIRRPFLILYLYPFPVWGSSVAMRLSPHWGPEDPSGFHSSFYVCIYVSTYICLSVRFSDSLFGDQNLRPVIAGSTCGHWPRGQITWVAV